MANKGSGSSIIRNWNVTAIPNFKGWKVHVLGGAFYGQVVRLMALGGLEKADGIEDADVVVFVGGSDIDPALYGEKPTSHVYGIHKERDLYEEAVYRRCVKEGKTMFGICRGAQFLWAMNKGKLWQHVNNHASDGHFIVDLEEDVRVWASSMHHQALLWDTDTAPKSATLLAVTEDNIANVFVNQDNEVAVTKEMLSKYDGPIEVEAAYIEDTKCFLVQGHPEIGREEYASWCMTKLFELMLEWEDVSEESDDTPDVANEVAGMVG